MHQNIRSCADGQRGIPSRRYSEVMFCPWLLLGGAIAAEVFSTVFLRLSDGFTRAGPVAVSMAGYALSFYLVSRTLKTIPVGTTYAVWSAVGTAVVACLSVVVFGESLGPAKLASLAVIIGGVIALQVSS